MPAASNRKPIDLQGRSPRSIYDTTEWKALRKRLLPPGQKCACGCGRRATDLHHRIWLSRGGDPFALDNLVPLAAICHRRVHSGKIETP